MTVGTALGRLLFSRNFQPFSLLVFASKFRALASMSSFSSGVGVGFNRFGLLLPLFTFGGAGDLTFDDFSLNCFEIN
jgi:hypothetical protein